MADDSEEWISARDAVKLLKPVAGDKYSAQMTICERANDGLIRSRALRYVLGTDERDNVELKRGFWRHRGHTALEQNWNTGDFAFWSDRDTYCRAYGVEFLRADIMKMVPASSAVEQPTAQTAKPLGEKIFIGHGRSHVWRDLKDFIVDRLNLPYDEFNAESAAGVTNVERLSEMLDNAAFAFLVLTAEDEVVGEVIRQVGPFELVSGGMQARVNVVHEAGLFQGRLGFKKAIILLEDGCGEFSNITGLGQIRFPKGSIGSKFEEIRRVLEREGIIQKS